MSYGGGHGGNRNLDMSKTETDLAINIRKATSIGMHAIFESAGLEKEKLS